MNTREVILSRRTVQRFNTESVPEGCVERAVQCALRAPNHKLTNPWRFRRVGPKTRAELVDVTVKIKAEQCAAKGKQLKAESIEKIKAKVSNSAELIIVTQLRNDDDAFRSREDYGATACAIQNLMLSLWSEGVGSKWGTGKPTRHPDTYRAADIDPAREEIIGFIWIGHPQEPPTRSPRRPLDEVYFELP